MEESSPDQATDDPYEQLLNNLDAGQNLEDALLEWGEDAMNIFFLDPEGDWIEDLPTSKATGLRKLLRRFAPFIKLGPVPLR